MATKKFLFKAPISEPIILEINGESIQCVEAIDGLRLLLFTSIVQGHYGTGVRAGEVQNFLHDVILGDQTPIDLDDATATEEQKAERDAELAAREARRKEWDKFEKVIAKYKIDIEGLMDITTWLADQYSERPTGPAVPSSDGLQSDGPSSVESSSSSDSIIPV